MNTKEYRIGNWITEYGLPCQIVELTEDKIITKPIYPKEGQLLIAPKKQKPIKLNVKVLLFQGFVKLQTFNQNYDTYALGDKMTIIHEDGINMFWYADAFGEVVRQVKYLHQIQNIHFILKNRELEFNF